MSGHLWQHIDPRNHRDGVFYLPAMMEIQPAQDDWGHPRDPGLLARVDADRPHGRTEDRGKFLCLKCMRMRAERGLPAEPVWMYLQQRAGSRPRFHHCSGTVADHEEHIPPGESDKHKALVEREVRVLERVGAKVSTEVRAANGRRRADWAAKGAVEVYGEVQLTDKGPRSIGQRQRDLTSDGARAIWTTDHRSPEFTDLVPRAVLQHIPHWRDAVEAPRLNVISGFHLIEYHRCGHHDLWTGGIRCPVTGHLRSCGRIHAYPYLSEIVSSASDLETLDLDSLIRRVVTGDVVPYQVRRGNRYQFSWIPADAYPRVVEERGGGDPGHAERSAGLISQQTRTADRTCETRGEDPIPRQGHRGWLEAFASFSCCGLRAPGQFGYPLVLACQLCPNSPTYWRHTRPSTSSNGDS